LKGESFAIIGTSRFQLQEEDEDEEEEAKAFETEMKTSPKIKKKKIRKATSSTYTSFILIKNGYRVVTHVKVRVNFDGLVVCNTSSFTITEFGQRNTKIDVSFL
jgi:hypothetical protein